MIEECAPNSPQNWSVSCPLLIDRICIAFPFDYFAMYVYILKEVGFWLPFTSFQMALLIDLTLAPFRLNPNTFPFMRAFEIVCEYLQIGATMPFFLRYFRVQRQSSEGQYNWVSFKNVDQCLFNMYVDSVIDFKDRYYIICPESESPANLVLKRVVVTDDERRRVLDEYGDVWTKLTSVLSFRWWKGHFLNDANDYA